ncbi:hypothetical protein Bca52824_011686 [Brassica carinata]|uniref:F-box domain-containing protein n=1 Tax=Brassica carinata TaxID=52824 RepID=A0A8X8B1N8_BRACI|nr:hypothetical protein Bca52824_011686 [Brassica carinata]
MLTSHGSRLELLLLNKKRSSVKLLLPDEVIELILERLPVMSLLRFKSVSKKWKSTVEDRRFQERQLICRKQSRGPDFLFLSLRDDDQNIKNAPIIFSRSEKIYNIWFRSLCRSICHGSCDGLVCLYDTRVGVVVANPATRWYQTFPLARIQQLLNHMSVSPVPKLGFGKDKLKGTYKPVFLYNSFGFGLDNVTTCELFDVSTNAWRYVRPASPYRINAYNNPVYFDGSLYWLTELEEKVLSFDLHSETFQVICKAPIAHVRDPSSVCMCILDNSLCVLENNRFTLKIWSLDCSGGNTTTWKKLCSLDLTSRSFFGECALLPIAILDKTKLLLGSSHECTQQLRVMIAEAETRGVMEEEMQTQKKEEEEEEEGPPPGWESTVLPPPISAVTTAVNSTTTTTAEITEMAQMVCGSCRRLLSYPRGTKHVKCSCCQTVNLVLEAHQVGQVKCSSCELLLMYPYGAPSVRCSSCKSVTDIREDNKRPPWSVQQGPLKTFSSVR